MLSTEIREHTRPKILVTSRYFEPGDGGGGTVRSLQNIFESLKESFAFSLVTTDRDVGSAVSYDTVELNKWVKREHCPVFYSSKGSLGLIRKSLAQDGFSLLYVNSLFDSAFSQRVLWSRKLKELYNVPVLVAPRGELSPGALAIKGTKKRTFLAVSLFLNLYHDIHWHASTDLEAEDIMRAIPSIDPTRIHVAINIPFMPKVEFKCQKSEYPNERLRVCFLSRISRKKNLGYALSVLCKVSSLVDFSVYGPIEDQEYWNECLCIAERLPKNIKFQYCGSIPSDRVVDVLGEHDMFFLPTLGENFGHVINEAMLAGLPVLLSDQTPWRDLEDNGVGWSLPLDDSSRFVDAIEFASSWSVSEWGRRTQSVQSYIRQKSEVANGTDAHLKMFNNVITRRSAN